MSEKKELGSDPAAPGQWLYRQGELVLGPVPTEQIAQLLFSGAIDARTEISTVGASGFQPIAEIPDFKVQLAKAEAKRRVDVLAQLEKVKADRRHKIAVGVVSVIAIVVASLAALGARYFAVHNPFKKLELAEITVEPPTIARFRSRHREEDLLAYPGRKSKVPERAGRSERGSSPARLGTAEDPDGMQTARFDKDGIHSVVAAHQKSLYGCFTEESGRNPKLAGKFPIEFVIGNDGHVSKLWVDNPDYKQGPLADCLLRELQRWPFHSYQGEQATVGLSFNVRSRG